MLSARDEAGPKRSETGEIVLGYRSSLWHTLGTTFADDALALNVDGISNEIQIDSCRADRRNGVRRPWHLLVALEACHRPREQSVETLGQHRHTVSTGVSAVNGTHLNVPGLTRPSAISAHMACYRSCILPVMRWFADAIRVAFEWFMARVPSLFIW